MKRMYFDLTEFLSLENEINSNYILLGSKGGVGKTTMSLLIFNTLLTYITHHRVKCFDNYMQDVKEKIFKESFQKYLEKQGINNTIRFYNCDERNVFVDNIIDFIKEERFVKGKVDSLTYESFPFFKELKSENNIEDIFMAQKSFVNPIRSGMIELKKATLLDSNGEVDRQLIENLLDHLNVKSKKKEGFGICDFGGSTTTSFIKYLEGIDNDTREYVKNFFYGKDRIKIVYVLRGGEYFFDSLISLIALMKYDIPISSVCNDDGGGVSFGGKNMNLINVFENLKEEDWQEVDKRSFLKGQVLSLSDLREKNKIVFDCELPEYPSISKADNLGNFLSNLFKGLLFSDYFISDVFYNKNSWLEFFMGFPFQKMNGEKLGINIPLSAISVYRYSQYTKKIFENIWRGLILKEVK